MKTEISSDSVFIGGVEYAPKSNSNLAPLVDGLPYVIIRTYSAGVHMGYLKSKEYTNAGIVVELVKTRRIYSWSGAMTLSQLALEGSTKPADCKFTVEIPSITIVAIEIIPVSETSEKILKGVKAWKI